MAISPDGFLFITSGERQKFTPAQNMDMNLGKIIRLNNPHVIIPEYYLTKGVSITLSTLGSACEWTLQQESHEVLNAAELVLNPEQVAQHDRHIMYFGDNHLSE